MKDTISCKNDVKTNFLNKIREFGIANAARVSGELLATIERWLYEGIEPRLDKAVNVLNAIGYKLSVSSVEELASEIRQFGTTALHKTSGISKSTLRSYLYVGKTPTLYGVDRIMTAIGKPLQIIRIAK